VPPLIADVMRSRLLVPALACASGCTLFAPTGCSCGCYEGEPTWHHTKTAPTVHNEAIAQVLQIRASPSALRGQLANQLWYAADNGSYLLCVPKARRPARGGCLEERYIIEGTAGAVRVREAGVICLD
jgi:hypothetical protein